MYCWGNNESGQLGNGTLSDSPVPVLVAGNLLLDNVAVGSDRACATHYQDDSLIFCWGSDSLGALGNPSDSLAETCHGQPCATTPIPARVPAAFIPEVFGRRWLWGERTDASNLRW
jgi:alpha-tubulin suppressor-like RCC1 family protein